MSTENNNHQTYDGIVEENNPMPGWWVWLFIFCVIFGAIYWIHYTFGGGPTLTQEFHADMSVYNQIVEKAQSVAIIETEESLAAYMKVDANVLSGSTLFNEKCAMCHGHNLEGKIGPNLTDNFWINGKGSRLEITNLVSKGVPAKGMPAWDSMLKPGQIKNVAAFVFSKIGSHPANAKEAQGLEIK